MFQLDFHFHSLIHTTEFSRKQQFAIRQPRSIAISERVMNLRSPEPMNRGILRPDKGRKRGWIMDP
ncbi:hypothetical protein SPHINGOR109_50756 [Sphingorhabdus sp. 109]|nr:hypothetical protein SPHINGOR109_50756 [Sphingorhabdus sp. 109]